MLFVAIAFQTLITSENWKNIINLQTAVARLSR